MDSRMANFLNNHHLVNQTTNKMPFMNLYPPPTTDDNVDLATGNNNNTNMLIDNQPQSTTTTIDSYFLNDFDAIDSIDDCLLDLNQVPIDSNHHFQIFNQQQQQHEPNLMIANDDYDFVTAVDQENEEIQTIMDATSTTTSSTAMIPESSKRIVKNNRKKSEKKPRQPRQQQQQRNTKPRIRSKSPSLVNETLRYITLLYCHITNIQSLFSFQIDVIKSIRLWPVISTPINILYQQTAFFPYFSS
ncbi:hypothetical protein DERP_013692 [Dermatophagoides pteronyssinus]|uniref:BHLH domain-containing protein n=1 Tax=Dermatophagoides pteronyssinus TaxID=6956 RepID=A0ABQ8JVL1_DERPT|nr:hypothetical protein DERP_013692 [Dermatophagoides pteronyssinus]